MYRQKIKTLCCKSGSAKSLGKLLLGAALFFISPHTAVAQTTLKDLQVAARAVSFSTDAPSGSTDLIIIYDPSSDGSTSDAKTILAAIGTGLKAGKATLVGRLVTVGELGSVMNAGAAIVAFDSGPHHSAVFQTLSAKGILTLSADMACVNANKCVLGIQTAPAVKIVISKEAREQSKASFGSAFMMLVTEQ